MINDNYLILDLMYSINDTDYYMSAIRFNGEKIKVKLSKKEFLKWCKELEYDEQGWELSMYARMISNI